MDISIFEAVGPLMIGPSSSHTAGAARLGRAAAAIVREPFTHVSFGLHGSFAKTYKGHGTDIALVAGVLGMAEDEEELRNAFALAAARGLGFDFYETELEGMHENSVKMTFRTADGSVREVCGSSLGGGQILICGIDGFPVKMRLNNNTLFIVHQDKKGVISQVTRILADNNINIGTMTVTRQERGAMALSVIETDSLIEEEALGQIRAVEHLKQAQAIKIDTVPTP